MVDLGGCPLIEHTFRVAQECQGIDRVFLSTDIPEAIDLARKRYPKVEVPFVRPAELCTDATSQVDVVMHLLDHLRVIEKLRPDTLLLLQPTSPFRRASEVDQAIKEFRNSGCESMLGVAPVLHHPADYLYRSNETDAQFRWVMRAPEWRRRQDFPAVYFNTGALYICSVTFLLGRRGFFDERSRLFQMANESALDLDTPFDLAIARGWLAVKPVHREI